jgi:hypothetical protein
MPVTQTVVYQKSGATFSSGLEAHQDKNSLYDAELTESIDQCHAIMAANNVLIGPTIYTWDQETQQLTIQRTISNGPEFLAARTYNVTAVTDKSTQAGWVFISGSIS